MNYDEVKKELFEKEEYLKMYLTLDQIFEILLMIRDSDDNYQEQVADLAKFVREKNEYYYDQIKEKFI